MIGRLAQIGGSRFVDLLAAHEILALPFPSEYGGVGAGLLTLCLAIEEIARKMLTSPNATIFPGPMVLWAWNEHAMEKAKAVLEIAAQVPEAVRGSIEAGMSAPEASPRRRAAIDFLTRFMSRAGR